MPAKIARNERGDYTLSADGCQHQLTRAEFEAFSRDLVDLIQVHMLEKGRGPARPSRSPVPPDAEAGRVGEILFAEDTLRLIRRDLRRLSKPAARGQGPSR